MDFVAEPKSARPVDLHAICRLCLSDRIESLKSVYDEILGPNRLPQKIDLLLQLQISKHDKLSTMVCNDCIIRLDTWFSYKRQCHRNQTKLVEWLNISKENGETNIQENNFLVKQEQIDSPAYGLLPVKTELTYDYDEYNDVNLSGYSQFENSSLFLDDEEINNLETDDDRRCPDCGRMFGSSQNRKRHQVMMHAKKERRAQMIEIQKPPRSSSSKQEELKKTEIGDNKPLPMDLEPSSCDGSTDAVISTTGIEGEFKEVENKKDDTKEKDEQPNNLDNGDPFSNDKEAADNDMSTDALIDGSDPGKEATDAPPQASDAPIKEMTDQSEKKDEEIKSKPTSETNEPSAQEDEKKIQFAAGLRLVQKDAAPIEMENLSKIELSYIEKCKAMVSMFHTLQCACHNVQHKTMRHMLSHLRDTRIWFPLFTCYNCMISLTDRSTFTKHYGKCPRPQLETLIKLSNVRKRSEVKSRLYQNFKCNRCRFLFSFHEDFCKHIDEEHASGSPPFYCSCRYVFDSLEEYKTHCYSSCILSYYCDICFITTSTIEEFIKHAQEDHDSSEGFVLLQENTYIPRNFTVKHKEADDEANVVEGKRERRKSMKDPIMVQIYEKEMPLDVRDIPTRVIKNIIQTDHSFGLNRNHSRCPLCSKQYSNLNNMVRHYRTHIEKGDVEVPKFDDEETGNTNEDLYTCPDCGGVYPISRWEQHLEEKHSSKKCSECDKEFQFQDELDQHRSVHLNIKVYKDSKTQSYMLSPTETNGTADDLLVCDSCDAMFEDKEQLEDHKVAFHDFVKLSAEDSMDSEEVDETDEHESKQEETKDEKNFCKQCERFFASPGSLRDHIINQHGAQYLGKSEYPKKCQICGKVCTTGSAYKLHSQMHERMNPTENTKNEYPKKCEYCDKMCASGAGLYIHTQMHERVTLGELKKKKDVRKKVIEYANTEEESYHTCNRCFKVFANKFKLKEHMKSHGVSNKSNNKKGRKVLCDLCHVAVDSQESLEQHKAEEHSEEVNTMLDVKMEVDEDSQSTYRSDSTAGVIYACDICEETFSSKPELRSHKDNHHKPKNKFNETYCKYCKISFSMPSELTKHMESEHDETGKVKVNKFKGGSDKPFKCPICQKGFGSLGAMTTHTGWHKRGMLNDKYAINTPQATAASKMAKHVKVMNKRAAAASAKPEPVDVPDFQCSTCFMELPNETALQIHMLEQHGNLNAEMLIPRCNICNKDFATHDEYETHKRFHDFLERQKKHEDDLKRQIQTPIIQHVESVAESSNVNLKKFPCNWCKSVFSRQDTLNTHIKTHHKEHVKTEFECHVCNRIFDKQNALTIHLKVHQRQKSMGQQVSSSPMVASSSNSKVYVCSLCNMSFSFPKDLRAHTINAHPF